MKSLGHELKASVLLPRIDLNSAFCLSTIFFGSRINGNGLESGKRRTEDRKSGCSAAGGIRKSVSKYFRYPLSFFYSSTPLLRKSN
jgi:hypothetical protein